MAVDIICIPANGSPLNVIRVNLRLAPLEVSGSVASSEYGFELLPDLVACADWDQKDWDSRTLVDLGNMDPDERIAHHSKRLGPYLMYKSFSEDARKRPQAPNRHFLGVENIEPVYGSVYIFKVKNAMKPDDSSSIYEDLDKSFIDSAFKRKGISNPKSLRWLALQEGLK